MAAEGAFSVAFLDILEEAGGEVGCVVERGSACGHCGGFEGELFEERDWARGGCDDAAGIVAEAESEHELVEALLWVAEFSEFVDPRAVELWAAELFVTVGAEQRCLGSVWPE